jgi:uncharacterized protein YbjT (DUF2867 family)
MKTAIVIGGTGLVGRELVERLVADEAYSKIKLFSRKKSEFKSHKIEEFLVDFNTIGAWKNHLTGDVLFSTLGTTLKMAGSKENQYKVDFQYVFEISKSCFENQVKTMAIVSSIGASSKSKNFYLKMKGELEEAISKLGFESLYIHRPSILDGERKENRFAEQLGLKFMRLMSKLGLLKKYRPIHAKVVAEALIQSVNMKIIGVKYFEMTEMFEITKKNRP